MRHSIGPPRVRIRSVSSALLHADTLGPAASPVMYEWLCGIHRVAGFLTASAVSELRHSADAFLAQLPKAVDFDAWLAGPGKRVVLSMPVYAELFVYIRSKAGLHKWAAEVAAQGSFSAPFSPDDAGASLGGLPVPHLVVGTKADMTGKCWGQAHIIGPEA